MIHLVWIPKYRKRVLKGEVADRIKESRGTSPKGHARSHYDFVHWDIQYDLDVHSDKTALLK